MSTNLLSVATSIFAIQDVFLVTSKATLDRTYNQMESLVASVQIRHAVEPNCLMQTRGSDNGQQLLIMRRYLDTGFRLVGPAPAEQPDHPKTIAEIEVTFAADYVVTTGEKPEANIVSAFDENVLFHVWPYWREYVQNSLSRMRLPPIILPMFKRHRTSQPSPEGASVTVEAAPGKKGG